MILWYWSIFFRHFYVFYVLFLHLMLCEHEQESLTRHVGGFHGRLKRNGRRVSALFGDGGERPVGLGNGCGGLRCVTVHWWPFWGDITRHNRRWGQLVGSVCRVTCVERLGSSAYLGSHSRVQLRQHVSHRCPVQRRQEVQNTILLFSVFSWIQLWQTGGVIHNHQINGGLMW